jgi:hypothetical protein
MFKYNTFCIVVIVRAENSLTKHKAKAQKNLPYILEYNPHPNLICIQFLAIS